MTTIKISGGDLGGETMLVRCDLSQASASIEVDYCEGSGWCPTQYQCADTRHTDAGLARIGLQLAARAVEMPEDNFHADTEVV